MAWLAVAKRDMKWLGLGHWGALVESWAEWGQ